MVSFVFCAGNPQIKSLFHISIPFRISTFLRFFLNFRQTFFASFTACAINLKIMPRGLINMHIRHFYSGRHRNELRFALCFSFFSVFSSVFLYLLLCIALDLGTRIRTDTLRENFESRILGIRCDRQRFASTSETNLGFIVCCRFTEVFALE